MVGKDKNVQALYDSMVKAKKIVENPSLIDECPNKYWIVNEETVPKIGGHFLQYMQKALNLFVVRGWRCVSLESLAPIRGAFALMEKE